MLHFILQHTFFIFIIFSQFLFTYCVDQRHIVPDDCSIVYFSLSFSFGSLLIELRAAPKATPNAIPIPIFSIIIPKATPKAIQIPIHIPVLPLLSLFFCLLMIKSSSTFSSQARYIEKPNAPVSLKSFIPSD